MNDMFGIIVQLTRGPLLKVVSFLLFNLIKKIYYWKESWIAEGLADEWS